MECNSVTSITWAVGLCRSKNEVESVSDPRFDLLNRVIDNGPRWRLLPMLGALMSRWREEVRLAFAFG